MTQAGIRARQSSCAHAAIRQQKCADGRKQSPLILREIARPPLML
jgi:hypothetical protein